MTATQCKHWLSAFQAPGTVTVLSFSNLTYPHLVPVEGVLLLISFYRRCCLWSDVTFSVKPFEHPIPYSPFPPTPT